MARTLSMKDAVNEAIDQEMGRDPTVIMMGGRYCRWRRSRW